MDALERKLIEDFMASTAALQVQERFHKFTIRLVAAAEKYGLVLSNNSIFTAATRQQVFEFLANLIDLSSNRNVQATEEDQLLDLRAEPLQKLVNEMEALNMSIIPLILVSLEADRRYCLKESILVKVITRSGEISYMDLTGRSYFKLENFLQSGPFPFGILCFLEELAVLNLDNQTHVMKCKVVGRQLVFQSVADGVLSALNIAGMLGLMAASGQWVTMIGLLTVTTSIYLMVRGAMGFFDAQRYGGKLSERSIVYNAMLSILNFAAVAFVSLPYSVGKIDQLSGLTKTLLIVTAGMDLLWLLARPPLPTYIWIDT